MALDQVFRLSSSAVESRLSGIWDASRSIRPSRLSAPASRNTPPSELIVPPSKAADTFLWHRGGNEKGKSVSSSVAWQILSGARGWRKHPTFERFQMVTPCPFLNPSYAMNKMG